MEAVLELCGFLVALLPVLGSAAGERWRTERSRLLLHLLCLCQLCLTAGGDCRPVVALMQQLLPSCQQVGDVCVSSASLCPFTNTGFWGKIQSLMRFNVFGCLIGAAIGGTVDGRHSAVAQSTCFSAQPSAKSGSVLLIVTLKSLIHSSKIQHLFFYQMSATEVANCAEH